MTRRPPIATATFLLFLVLASCVPSFPREARDPEVVGMIVEVETGSQPDYVVTLATGRVVEVNREDTLIRSPEVGALYLGGNTDGKWHAFIPDEGDCWVISSEAERHGDRLHFRNSIRLPLADDMDFGWPGEEELYADPRTQFCVNESGEITRYRGPG